LQSEPPGVAGRPNAPDRPAKCRATAGRKSSFFLSEVFSMSRLKLEALLPGLVADFRAILLETQEYYAPSEINLPDAWKLLSKVSRDRAYDDSHPFFVANKWRRILPYDGRKYCFYYIDGANDNHVASLLKAVVSRLCEEHETTNISSK
jgi:hypothetical protein